MAILPRPRGGDWLEDEVRAWRAEGIDVVVSLLTPEEIADFDLASEATVCQTNGVQLISFPIPDRGVPASRTAATDLLGKLESLLFEGKNLGIHCRQGIGRSGLIAASLLVLSGIDPKSAIQRVTEARGCTTPETSEQRQWITAFGSAFGQTVQTKTAGH
jgi:protein-tyrosine phosphatase